MQSCLPKVGLRRLCRLFGRTRQAFYERRQRFARSAFEALMVVELVHQVRRRHPRMGGRKLYALLKGDLEEMGVKTGRDRFFDMLRADDLLVSRKRRGSRTTYARHWFRIYPNRVSGLRVERPEKVWVADITYIRLVDGFCYLSLITDAYSRKVVGYQLHRTLEAEGCLRALKVALASRRYLWECIHHSDRGIQYCSHPYVALLERSAFAISMTAQGSEENAIAERLNGILKDEYLLSVTFDDFEAAEKQVPQVIHLYNTERPHMSLDMLTPEEAHLESGPLKRHWQRRKKAAA